jgi:serine/threonine protein kinase
VTKLDFDEAMAPALQLRKIFGVLAGITMLACGVALTYHARLLINDRRVRSLQNERRQLGQYTLQEKIGEGAMGEVYRAEHVMLRRPTAVKLMRPEKSSEDAISRFEQEVQLTSQLLHPNTIDIYDYGRSVDGTFYYSMEYLDGCNLDQLVAYDGPQNPSRVIHLLEQVCGSLHEAHLAGLVHRDIKPANIFVCCRGGVPDIVKVLDFGLVRDMATRQGQVEYPVGTPAYMAPEALNDPMAVDPRSDVYSLGAVAYFLLTGQPFFAGTDLASLLNHHAETRTDLTLPPRQDVDRRLDDIVVRCLAKNRDQRPPSAASLAQALADCEAAQSWNEQQAKRWWSGFDTAAGKAEHRLSAFHGSRHLEATIEFADGVQQTR